MGQARKAARVVAHLRTLASRARQRAPYTDAVFRNTIVRVVRDTPTVDLSRSVLNHRHERP